MSSTDPATRRPAARAPGEEPSRASRAVAKDLHRRIFDEIPDALLVFDQDRASLITCNAAALNLFEAEDGEQVLRNCPAVPALLRQSGEDPRGTAHECEFTTCHERSFWGTVTVREFVLDGRAVRLLRISDVTERHRTLALLTTTQALAHVGGWELSAPGHHLRWSEEVYRIHELPVGTPVSLEDALAFYDPASRPVIAGAVRACLAEGTAFRHDLRIITHRGREAWVRVDGRADGAEPGARRIFGACQDISREHAAAAALQDSEQQLRQQAMLLDAANDAIVLVTPAGAIRFWNRAAERLFGWAPSEALGRPLTECAFAEAGLASGPLPVVLTQGDWHGELAGTTRTGTALTLDSRWTLIRNAAGEAEAILIISTDVTEKKRIEARVLRTQRLESIGTLAGGIAHDLNNILSPILLSGDMLRSRFAGTAEEELIDTICLSARRGADVVRQVLSFARGTEGVSIPLNLRHIFPDMRKIVRETFPRNVACETQAPPDLWNISADPTQIHQILLNLCLNAADAMPEGGTIRIEAANCAVDAALAARHTGARVGPHVRLRARDEGTGIPDAIREKIFDPFFTTKGPGRGSGLGLSTVLAIVQGHGGFLSVANATGGGAEFTLHFPALEENAELAPPAGTRPQLPEGNGETVLVIDDELSVRSIVRQSLEGVGYRVLTAHDGAEGLDLFRRERNRIALVLTDLRMPGLDGRHVLKELLRLAPDMRIIAMSGINRSPADVPAAIPANAAAFLLKPFTLESLLRTVRTALDTSVPAGRASPAAP